MKSTTNIWDQGTAGLDCSVPDQPDVRVSRALQLCNGCSTPAIALFVLWNVVRNPRKVGAVFLQHAPASFDLADFQRRLSTLPKVVSSHHAHTWTIDGEHHVLSLHVVMQHDATRDDIAEVKRRLRTECIGDNFEHVTVDVEVAGEECVDCHA
jgi:cobalt-zinc-cadmium efflux system protein